MKFVSYRHFLFIACDPATTTDSGDCPQAPSCLPFNGQCQNDNYPAAAQAAVHQMGAPIKKASAYIGGGLFGAQLFTGFSESTVSSVLNSVNLLLLLKYCNVEYPPNVEDFFRVISHNSSSGDSSFMYEPLHSVSGANQSYTSTWYRFPDF